MAEKLTLTGVVTKVEQRIFEPYKRDYYIPRNMSLKEYKLLVALKTEDGKEVWFYTPAVTYVEAWTVSAGFGMITTENDWITKSEERKPVWQVAVGDTITINGRVKNAATKYGLQLNYVSFAAKKAA